MVGPRGLQGSRNRSELGESSRVIADLVAEFYARVVPKYARGSLLDLGCGKAPLYGLYRPYVDNVTCVDWTNSPHENPNLDLAHDLNAPLPFESGTFGTVILSDVLEHIRRPSDLMVEISRVLVSKGTLLMNVPFFYRLHEEPYDYYRYTRYSLEYLTTYSGMKPMEITPIGGLPEIVGDIVSKSLIGIPYAGQMMAASGQGLTSAFVRTKAGHYLSLKTREPFPFGYVMVATKP